MPSLAAMDSPWLDPDLIGDRRPRHASPDSGDDLDAVAAGRNAPIDRFLFAADATIERLMTELALRLTTTSARDEMFLEARGHRRIASAIGQLRAARAEIAEAVGRTRMAELAEEAEFIAERRRALADDEWDG